MACQEELRIEVLSHPKFLRPVRGVVRSYLETYSLPQERIGEVVLAVDEACANAIRHSYAGETEHRVTLSFGADASWIEITLRDEGAPAPIESVQRKVGTQEPCELKPGGVGVQIMYAVFDEVEFCPGQERGNCVTMRLRRPTKGGRKAVSMAHKKMQG